MHVYVYSDYDNLAKEHKLWRISRFYNPSGYHCLYYLPEDQKQYKIRGCHDELHSDVITDEVADESHDHEAQAVDQAATDAH